MSRFVILVEFDLHKDGFRRFLDLVRDNAATSVRDEPGCERFDVLLPAGDPSRVLLYEIYRDRAAFEAHLLAPHFAAFDADTRGLVKGKRVTELALA
jgi:quinol monooxygenase YgiN